MVLVDVRTKMQEIRKNKGISLEVMSHNTGVSSGLISLIEGGYVTHPNIAKLLQKGYGLTDEETEMLMPEIHRKSSPNYDPKKYVALVDRKRVIPIPYHEHEEIDLYKSDRIKKEYV